MLKRPLFWIILIIIIVLVWFIYGQKSHRKPTGNKLTTQTSQPIQLPAAQSQSSSTQTQGSPAIRTPSEEAQTLSPYHNNQINNDIKNQAASPNDDDPNHTPKTAISNPSKQATQ